MPSTARAVLVATLVAAACGCAPQPREAGADREAGASPDAAPPPPAPQPATATPQPIETTASRPVEAASPAPAEAAPSRASSTTLSLALSAPATVAGLEFWASFDAARFTVAEPVLAAGMDGFLCAANVQVPGQLRWQCVRLPPAAVVGPVAAVGVGHDGPAPRPADFEVTKDSVVDEHGATIAGVRVVLQAPD